MKQETQFERNIKLINYFFEVVIFNTMCKAFAYLIICILLSNEVYLKFYTGSCNIWLIGIYLGCLRVTYMADSIIKFYELYKKNKSPEAEHKKRDVDKSG